MSSESIKIKKLTFGANKLATTVGANGLASEIVVPQPRISILVVEEVEYEFDQEKYEAYLSSSSKTSSPRKSKRTSAARRIRWASASEDDEPVLAAAEAEDDSALPAPRSTRSDLPSPPVQETSANGVVTISKRARQRRRQCLALQFAKAMESLDGVRYNMNLKSRRGHELKLPQPEGNSSKPLTNEWIRVKRNRFTLEERIRKRRALLAHAKALVRKARRTKDEEVAKKPPKMR